MKKLLIILCLLSGLLFSCSGGGDNKKVKRISWYNVEGTLVYAVDKFEYPYYCHVRYAYVKSLKDTNQIYFVNDIPEEAYDLYFKDAQKGDTIKI
jgi:hypothetical protein